MSEYNSGSESDDSSIIFVNNLDINENSSETNTDSEQNSDSEIDEFEVEVNDWEYDEIYQDDSHHVYSEKQHDHYYIGLAKRLNNDLLLMVNSVSPFVFFQYGFERIRRYLAQYSIVRVENAKIHIMKLCILDDGTYSVVLKTHWLRLVQRHWRKVYAERKRVIKGRRNLLNLRYREIHGKYSYGFNHLPSLRGMMRKYNEGDHNSKGGV
jgi:hypothetical protein